MSQPTQIVITRTRENDKCTTGTLHVYRDQLLFECVTLERPWEENKKFVSRIPASHYKATFNDSPKFGPTIKIHDVPDRENILIHIGNYPHDSLGCILVGTTLAEHEKAVWTSRPAMEMLLEVVQEPMYVNIVDAL